MTKQLHVTGIPKTPPEVRLYVLALIALARQLQEADRQAPHPPAPDRQREEGQP